MKLPTFKEAKLKVFKSVYIHE